MTNIYETYPVKDKLLPFHFHLENYQPNIDYPNWHDELELLYCIHEGGTVRCNGKQYEFKNNDIICVNSEELHSSTTNSRFVYYCLIVNSDFCRDNGIDISKLKFQTYITDEEMAEKFKKLILAYEDLSKCNKNDELQKAVIRLCVLDLLVYLSQNYQITKDNTESSNKLATIYVKKILEYISSNMSKSFTLDEISTHIGISKYHLTRQFKHITGHSLIEQINILKCNEALKLIASGTTVANAASQLGYNDLPYFSQMFKKHMGVPPSKSKLIMIERK